MRIHTPVVAKLCYGPMKVAPKMGMVTREVTVVISR
jgi:hypothetical protein